MIEAQRCSCICDSESKGGKAGRGRKEQANHEDLKGASAFASSASGEDFFEVLEVFVVGFYCQCLNRSGCILILDQGSAQMLSSSFVNGRVPVRLSWLPLITAAPLLLATEHLCAHPGPATSPRSIWNLSPRRLKLPLTKIYLMFGKAAGPEWLLKADTEDHVKSAVTPVPGPPYILSSGLRCPGYQAAGMWSLPAVL